MNKVILETVDASKNAKPKIGQDNSFFDSVLTVGIFIIGLILMTIGLFMSAFSFFSGIRFDRLETILLVAAFVLMAIGSHLLDLSEKKKKT